MTLSRFHPRCGLQTSITISSQCSSLHSVNIPPIYDSNQHKYFPVTYLIVGEKSHLITDYFLFPVTYFIAACFFSVYAMAVDTLFLCFLVDSENNDGTAEKPYYMSEGLMKILSVKNKAKYAK